MNKLPPTPPTDDTTPESVDCGSSGIEQPKHLEKTHDDYVTARMGAFLADIEKEVAYYSGRTVTGFSLTKKGERWLLVVRYVNRVDAEVSFTGGVSILDTFWEYAKGLKNRAIAFKEDKWRSKLDKSA